MQAIKDRSKQLVTASSGLEGMALACVHQGKSGRTAERARRLLHRDERAERASHSKHSLARQRSAKCLASFNGHQPKQEPSWIVGLLHLCWFVSTRNR